MMNAPVMISCLLEEKGSVITADSDACLSSLILNEMMKGSGRKKMNKKMPASRNAAADNMNGPASSGTPIDSAKLPMTSTRFGPATAPNVVENIAMLTAVPRCSFVARSVPAYWSPSLHRRSAGKAVTAGHCLLRQRGRHLQNLDRP